jgi:hypothetical protein
LLKVVVQTVRACAPHLLQTEKVTQETKAEEIRQQCAKCQQMS